MLKKLSLSFFVILFVCGLSAQNAGTSDDRQYQDIRDSVAAMNAVVDRFCEKAFKIMDAETAAKAINVFVDEYLEVIKNAAVVDARYPEFTDEENLPPAIKDIMAGAAELEPKLAEAFSYLSAYSQDQAVQDALSRLQTLETQ